MSDSLRVDLDRLHSSKGMKWTKYGKDVLPAFVADMDFEPPNSVYEALKEIVDLKDFGYKFNHIDRLIPAWTNWISSRDGLELSEDHCAIFTSSIHALEAVMVLHTKPNDGVALFSPVYHPFAKAVKNAGRKLIDIPLLEEDWTIDIEKFNELAKSEIKVVLFCQPHNPTGHLFSEDEIKQLAEIIIKQNLLVISDEIWADLIFDDKSHKPLAAHGQEIQERIVTVGSASKTFNLAGARCSVAHIGDQSIRKKLSAFPEHYFGQPSSFGAAATVTAWESGKPWLRNTLKQLHENRDFLIKSFAGTNIKMDSPQATYLAWLNFSNTNISQDPSKVILEKGRVALEPGSKFGPQSHSFARLNFATSPEILESIVERILEVLD
tara:strand:+ start:1938 stop:3077 length:1140 start_codon:yes stop_codon:yes gene_type:complete